MRLVEIDTEDDKIIYGLFNGLKKKSNKLVILVHGMKSNYQTYLMSRSLEVFVDNGFDAIAINFHDWRKGGRKEIETSLQDNVKDISTTVEYYREKYKEIYLVGHSLGGLAIMIANIDNISATSLWDPSFNLARFYENFKYINISDIFIWSKGSLVIAKEILDEFMIYNELECLKLSENFKSRIQVITADSKENVVFNKDEYSFHSKSILDNERIYIQNADHNFIENETYYELIKNTIRWFNK